MGLAAGLRAGTMFGSKMKENYDRGKEEDIENSLFKAYSELQQDSQALDEEGNMITTEAMDFANMSGDEITNSILREVTTAGGKIDDQTYSIAYKMGSMFQEKKDKATLFQQKQENLDLRSQNLQNSIFSRINTNARRQEKYELQKQGKWNPSGKRTLTGKEQKPTRLMQNTEYIREKYGDDKASKYVSSNWKAKEYADDTMDETDTSTTAETKKKSWKDYQ